MMEHFSWSSARQIPNASSCASSSSYGEQGERNHGVTHAHHSVQPCQSHGTERLNGELVSIGTSDCQVRTKYEGEKGMRERHRLQPEQMAASKDMPIYLSSSFSGRLSFREKREYSEVERELSSEGRRTEMRTVSRSKGSRSILGFPSVQTRTEELDAKFASLPFDVLVRIVGSFSWPNLWSATRVCRSWHGALAPFREAMLFVHCGKKFKHGRGGFARNLNKALDSFLKGAVRGCGAAMVDAGLLLWEMGRRDEGIKWYRQAAELGDPAGQCNLGLACLQDPSNPPEAIKWFQRAALAGHVRAQYSLALCLQQGRGVEANSVQAAHWYLKAARGGNARAMHNVALCYLKGEGMLQNHREARRWMKRAALAGHRKAQYDFGLTLLLEGDGGMALVFLELATRAGESAATHPRDALLEELSPKMRAHAIACADKWQVKQNSRP
eukprot:c22211_g1_i1 orf=215-1540(+)